MKNDLQLTLFHVLRTKLFVHIFITKSFNMITNNNAQQFFYYNQFNHMVISELHAKLIQQR